MKTVVNKKTVVNFKLQTFLFAFSLLMHLAASSVARSHPLLGWLFALLEIIGWFSILTAWVLAFIRGIHSWGPMLWTQAWTYARTHARLKKAKAQNTFVPVEQLALVRQNMQRLGLAFHGLTPEMEMARRTHFQMLGEALPPLVLPPQHATLYAEFESLVRVLNHFGFPSLESVQLQYRDLAFIQHWGSDLERCLHQLQARSRVEQDALRLALATVAQQHTTLGETCAAVQHHSGYQRIQGALRFLEKMVNDDRCRWDLAQTYVQKLQSDMHALMKQCEHISA